MGYTVGDQTRNMLKALLEKCNVNISLEDLIQAIESEVNWWEALNKTNDIRFDLHYNVYVKSMEKLWEQLEEN